MGHDSFKIGFKGRLKHGLLLEALSQRGWSQRQAAKFLGVSMQAFGRWINLRDVPRRLTEKQVQKLVELTGQLPEALWPDYVRSRDFLDASKTFTVVKDVEARKFLTALTQRELPPTPEEVFAREEMTETIDMVLATLPARDARIIKKRFYEEKTCEEVGVEEGVTRERVRQIEDKALRKLRRPNRIKQLKPFI